MTAVADIVEGQTAQERWIRSFVTLYLEVEAGLRPARHLRPLMSPDLQPVVGGCGRQGRTPDVLTVRVQSRRGVCEAVVLLQEPTRVAALAVAMRRDQHGWRICEVRRPDGGLPPDPTAPRPALPVQTWHELVSTRAQLVQVMPEGWARRDAARAA